MSDPRSPDQPFGRSYAHLLIKPDWECTIEERPYRDFIPIAVTGRVTVTTWTPMTAADLGIVDQNLDDKVGMEP